MLLVSWAFRFGVLAVAGSSCCCCFRFVFRDVFLSPVVAFMSPVVVAVVVVFWVS